MADDDECKDHKWFLPFILCLVWILMLVIYMIVFLIINRKYLGAGGIRIKKETAHHASKNSKQSKPTSKKRKRDEVTDYDVTVAQTTVG
ncbi:hypothetical protein QR680_018510 [Steinernema hermaphroditum]|uniref:Uncharacterized protein n=1 Tax=Steinernema hermaphroditum TaxID=289476 RepID=A0AA39HKF3_9BILA|nr:hypothetical protein QR680_018510 [Steinernema hermaphroditum]